MLSSHLLGDLRRVCDHLIVLAAGQVELAGDVDDLLAVHHRLTGARGDVGELPAGVEVIQAEHTARESVLIVRTASPTTGPTASPTPGAERIDLEDLVLAYMTRAANGSPDGISAKPLEARR